MYDSPSPRTGSSSLDVLNPLFNQQATQHALDDTRGLLPSQEKAKDFESPSHYLQDFTDTLEVMQDHFFEVWLGEWPEAIDWTAAVMGTHVSASLNTLTQSSDFSLCENGSNRVSENLVNEYFSHLTSFYFGQDFFSIRSQAYDDMLWVVLGWLESTKFIDLHSRLHFSTTTDGSNSTWYAEHFIPAYAHRARIFWDLASVGWDTTLCGGGMIWNPRLKPYKNAITNQLYIAASVSMYLYFPGDNNTSPYIVEQEPSLLEKEPVMKHDEKYLEAALDAYMWIINSNMTNTNGLFIDGFHISHRHGAPGKDKEHLKCDIPNDMVFTYNQGVILTGQRGLWEATGAEKYLEDGHNLIRNVIRATGWPTSGKKAGERDEAEWAGLGRNGVLEDACDSSGSCSQDGQTFKGIFFHHMTMFCAPLPVGTKEGIFYKADPTTAARHRASCQSYVPWVAHNARAALGTKDEHGEFGMWWTYGLLRANDSFEAGKYKAHAEGVDYRNYGVPHDEFWVATTEVGSHPALDRTRNRRRNGSVGPQAPLDPNDRGRGRTVETQSGGLAILRALYKMAGSDRD